MMKFSCSIVLALVLGLFVSADAASDGPLKMHGESHGESRQVEIDQLGKAYLAMVSLLAKDNYEASKKAMDVVHSTAHGLENLDNKSLAKLAAQIGAIAHKGGNDIVAIRAAAKQISKPMIELATAMPLSAKVAPHVYVAHCSMAKASWLQTTKSIANPYYGSQMLACGEVTKEITNAKK